MVDKGVGNTKTEAPFQNFETALLRAEVPLQKSEARSYVNSFNSSALKALIVLRRVCRWSGRLCWRLPGGSVSEDFGCLASDEEPVRVGDVLQEESACGHALAGGAAIAGADHVVESVEGEAVLAHFEQCAHHGAHHVAQEAVGGDFEAPGLQVFLDPAGAGEVAGVGLVVGAGLAETAEVGVLHEAGGGFVHQREVEGIVVAAGIGPAEGVLALVEVVVVGACRGAEAGVGVVGDGHHGVDADVGGQQAVEFEGQLRAVHRLVRVEVGHHETGVHAGVGASRGHEIDVTAQDGGHHVLHLLLYAHGVGLALPAVVLCAVVGQINEIPHLTVMWKQLCLASYFT